MRDGAIRLLCFQQDVFSSTGVKWSPLRCPIASPDSPQSGDRIDTMEEISEHPQLLQLEAATLADVDQFGACSLTDKARVQKLSLSIQGKLSQIRALTRDLELLVEELDRRGGLQGLMTTASWLTALPPVQLARCWCLQR